MYELGCREIGIDVVDCSSIERMLVFIMTGKSSFFC